MVIKSYLFKINDKHTVLRGGRAIPDGVPGQAWWKGMLGEHAGWQWLQARRKAREHRTWCTRGARRPVVTQHGREHSARMAGGLGKVLRG